MYAIIVCMQVFSFNIRLIFLYVISYCLLVRFHPVIIAAVVVIERRMGGGMRVIRASRVDFVNKGSGLRLERGEESSTKSSRSPFSLCVFLFSVRFVLTTYSTNVLSLSLYLVFFSPLNYFMEDLLIDCCLWLLVLRVLLFFPSRGALKTC